MTHAVFINLATGKAHSEPLADAPAPKIVLPLRSQQSVEFGFFRTGAARTVTGDAVGDVFTAEGHGLTDDQGFIFTELTGGSGLVVDTVRYFARDTTEDTFKVARTPGGAAVNFASNVTEGTFKLSTLPLTVTGWTSGKVVVKHKPEGAVLLLTSEVTESGSGDTARYTAAWTAETNDGEAARAFVEGQTVPRQCMAELEWVDADGTHRVAFPIKLVAAFNDDDDGAPDPLDSEALSWLAAHALRFDAPQELSGPQIVQALGNLGITIAEDGKITFHTGHWIDLNAPES